MISFKVKVLKKRGLPQYEMDTAYEQVLELKVGEDVSIPDGVKLLPGLVKYKFGDSDIVSLKTEDDTKKFAYACAVHALDSWFHGQWKYAYGDLQSGQFTGQFQFIDGLGGDLVPAVVERYDSEYVPPTPPTREEMRSNFNASVDHMVAELSKSENADLKTSFAAFNANPDKHFMFGGWEDELSLDQLSRWQAIVKVADELAGGHSGASFAMACRATAAKLKELATQ